MPNINKHGSDSISDEELEIQVALGTLPSKAEQRILLFFIAEGYSFPRDVEEFIDACDENLTRKQLKAIFRKYRYALEEEVDIADCLCLTKSFLTKCITHKNEK